MNLVKAVNDMNTIDKIRAEIERRKGYISVTHFAEDLLSFLDTLPDEPVSDDLEEEISTWIPAHISGGDDGVLRYTKNVVTKWAGVVASHFAEWQKRKMMEGAVEADVNIYRDIAGGESWAEFVVAKPPKNLGDKVKIIIVKEEE